VCARGSRPGVRVGNRSTRRRASRRSLAAEADRCPAIRCGPAMPRPPQRLASRSARSPTSPRHRSLPVLRGYIRRRDRLRRRRRCAVAMHPVDAAGATSEALNDRRIGPETATRCNYRYSAFSLPNSTHGVMPLLLVCRVRERCQWGSGLMAVVCPGCLAVGSSASPFV
jgi:hypothetical protein